MDKKQIAWYLIFGGSVIVLLTFISTIISFMGDHPWLSISVLSILIGVVLLVLE